MSFQAYLDNIKAKSGQTPEDIKKQLEEEEVFGPDMTFTDLAHWLRIRYDLGHGYSLAIWAYFKMKGWVNVPKKK